MPANFQYDVILSHNPQDKPRVRRLAEKLRDAGLDVWFDEWALEPGDDAARAAERGLAASRVLVLCLSPAALGADWVTLERSTVPFRDPAQADRRFVPLLLADCDLPDTLLRYRAIDYGEETEAAFDELLDERERVSEAAGGQGEPPDHFRRREVDDGGGVAGAGWVLLGRTLTNAEKRGL
jgi:hypothetical protein